jgi:hypothetical protein
LASSRVGNDVQLDLPAIYPDSMAPVIKLDRQGARNLTMMRPRPLPMAREIRSLPLCEEESRFSKPRRI